MKTILKSLLTASLLLASVTTTAQNVVAQDLESWMETILCQADERKVEVSRNIGHERDVQKEGTPLKWRRDIITLTLPKKHRNLLDDMIRAFESNAQYNPKCYGVNSQRGASNDNASNSIRRMMYGDFPMDYVEIGKDYNNYINVNILDDTDTTKTHRYAYALEWREQSGTSEKGAIDVRYIVTYAKIPTNFTATIQYPSSDLADAVKDMIKNGRELRGRDFAFDELLSEDNILLTFSKLKNQYNLGFNPEFNAISIYLLCKRARAYGYFKGEDSKAMLKQLKDEVRELVSTGSGDKAVLYYLQQALLELEQIK